MKLFLLILIAIMASVIAAMGFQRLAADDRISFVKFNVQTQEYEFCFECPFDPTADAWGAYVDTISENGWSELSITTNPGSKDSVAMFAAGYLEGALTWERIAQFNRTYLTGQLMKNPPTDDLMGFVQRNDVWTREQVAAYASSDPYWYQVSLQLTQLDGLVAGYNAIAPPDQFMQYMTHLLNNYIGDYGDVVKATNRTARPAWHSMTAEQVADARMENEHCSGLIKVTDDASDLFVAHNTWGSYQSMLRIFKTYNFSVGLGAGGTVNTVLTFSSYPGVLSSDDDFIMANPQKLAIIETTNSIYNNSLFDLVVPETVLYWIRSMVASRMAASGAAWMKLFAQHNSGTYNNQWMVVDYKLFVPGQPLPDGLLWVGEQIPGQMPFADMTPFLRLGYWPSYNVPFFESIYEIAGWPEMYQQFGSQYSYSTCPRANIFRRDQESCQSLDGMKRLMMYNDWQHDPLSLGLPDGAISARSDMRLTNAKASGGIDTKLTSSALIAQRQAWCISGPTHQQQAAFSWQQAPWNAVAHEGQPSTFLFDYVLLGGSQ